jgi:hypothetical protein
VSGAAARRARSGSPEERCQVDLQISEKKSFVQRSTAFEAPQKSDKADVASMNKHQIRKI